MTMTRPAVILLVLPFLFFGAGALTASVATRVAEYVAPAPTTLLEAAELRQEEAIFRMISTGDDPGLAVTLERPLLHWRRGDVTTPILVAVAGGDVTQAAYMVRHTQLLAQSPNDLALCVAARFGHSNIARFLMKRGVPAVPKNGCGELRRPEDIAQKQGSGGLARELRQYRIEER